MEVPKKEVDEVYSDYYSLDKDLMDKDLIVGIVSPRVLNPRRNLSLFVTSTYFLTNVPMFSLHYFGLAFYILVTVPLLSR